MRFRTLGAYSALAYLNQAANVLVNLLFIKYLSLSTLGDIAIAKVWMQVMDYSHLGLRFSLDRYVPTWEKDKSTRLLWLCVAVSTVVSASIMIVALLAASSPILTLVFSVWGYCTSIATILKNFYRASADSHRMLTAYLICPTIPAVVQAVAFYFFGFSWFLGATAASASIATLYLLHTAKPEISDAIRHARGVISAVKSATASLLVNSIVLFLTFSIDRIVMNHYTTKAVLGEYSIILFAFALLLIVPSTFAEFIFPRIVSETVQSGRKFYPREILTLLGTTALFVLTAYVIAPILLIEFTKYGHLSGMVQLAMIGVLPYAVTPVLFHVMSALDMRKQLVVSAVLSLTIYTATLIWGGLYAEDKLQFFTVARSLYGYVLLGIYTFCILNHKRKAP